MEEVRIRIAVDKLGNSVTEVNGVKGEGCRALTAGIERAMGDVLTDEDTPEMWETEHSYEPETARA